MNTFKTAEELEQDFLNYLDSTDCPNLYKKIYYLSKTDFYDLYKYTEDCFYLKIKNIEELIYKKNTEPLIYDFFKELEKNLKDLEGEEYNNSEYNLINASNITWHTMIYFFKDFKKENEKNKIYLIEEDYKNKIYIYIKYKL